MSDDFLSLRRTALEESFFRNKDAELIRQLQEQRIAELRRQELAAVSGIHEAGLLDRLVRLQLGPDTVAALSLVPLVRVAWADGRLDNSERDAILKAATESGIQKDSASYGCLLSWLEEKPTADLNTAWTDYVRELCKTLADEDRNGLREGIVGRAQHIAAAAGGFLGLGNKVTETEQAELDRINAAFS